MSDETKRILTIGGFIALVCLIAYGLWVLFFRPLPPPPTGVVPTPTAQKPSAGLPSAPTGRPGVAITPETGTGPSAGGIEPITTSEKPRAYVAPTATGGLTRVTTLTSGPISAPIRASGGRGVAVYSQSDGLFYRVTDKGDMTPLSARAFKNVEKVTWSPNASQAILEFPDGANVLYRFDGDTQVTLPKHWEDFGFDPTGSSIALKSMGLDPEDRWLAVSDPDGSNATPIEPLGDNGDKVTVNWSPNQQMVATLLKSRDGTRQELIFLGKNKENFRLAVLEGRQFVGQWMPKGDRMLYSVYSAATDYRPSLWMVDAGPETSGDNRRALNVQTWADKCTTAPDSRTIFCAVPRELPTGAGIVREVAKNIPDDLYRIDTDTGVKTLIAIPAGNDITASNLLLSENQKTLFFQNAQTGALQKIDLK